MSTPKEMAAELFQRVQKFVADAMAPVLQRVDEVETKVASFKVPADGKDGAPGKDGKDGVDGKNGENGKDGVDGLIGKDGAPGKDGKDGVSVDVDAIERAVNERVEKRLAEIEQPRDGRDGQPGQRGERGRDALQIDILPDINPEKSYPRGTFATHRGGLWRSKSTTDGMQGWECIVEGMHEVTLKQDESDPRLLTVAISKSGGESIAGRYFIPTVIDKGVFREEDAETYVKGDGLTFGGSWYITQKDKPQGKPGQSNDFRLAAKHGRDGKDGRAPRDPNATVKLS